MNTGLSVELDAIGVKRIPESPGEKVEHIYGDFREKLHFDLKQERNGKGRKTWKSLKKWPPSLAFIRPQGNLEGKVGWTGRF